MEIRKGSKKGETNNEAKGSQRREASWGGRKGK